MAPRRGAETGIPPAAHPDWVHRDSALTDFVLMLRWSLGDSCVFAATLPRNGMPRTPPCHAPSYMRPVNTRISTITSNSPMPPDGP